MHHSKDLTVWAKGCGGIPEFLQLNIIMLFCNILFCICQACGWMWIYYVASICFGKPCSFIGCCFPYCVGSIRNLNCLTRGKQSQKSFKIAMNIKTKEKGTKVSDEEYSGNKFYSQGHEQEDCDANFHQFLTKNSQAPRCA